jgi:hypothetical protein
MSQNDADSNETRWIFKVIWAWQDEKEEQWLENMALQGWHLESVAPFFYKFRKSKPCRAIYRLDYKVSMDKDYAQYRALFEDSDWKLVCTMSNWHYYRIEPENGKVPEIYNGNRARAQKYRRLLAGLLPVIVIFVVVLNPVFSSENEGGTGTFFTVVHIFFAAILLFLLFGAIRILLKIRKLESESKE